MNQSQVEIKPNSDPNTEKALRGVITPSISRYHILDPSLV